MINVAKALVAPFQKADVASAMSLSIVNGLDKLGSPAKAPLSPGLM